MVQQKHAQFQCGDTVVLKLRLFQTILVPTVHYGCAAAHGACIARWLLWPTLPVHNCNVFMKGTLGSYVGCNLVPPLLFLLAELNLTCEIFVYWWRQSLKLWNCNLLSNFCKQSDLSAASCGCWCLLLQQECFLPISVVPSSRAAENIDYYCTTQICRVEHII